MQPGSNGGLAILGCAFPKGRTSLQRWAPPWYESSIERGRMPNEFGGRCLAPSREAGGRTMAPAVARPVELGLTKKTRSGSKAEREKRAIPKIVCPFSITASLEEGPRNRMGGGEKTNVFGNSPSLFLRSTFGCARIFPLNQAQRGGLLPLTSFALGPLLTVLDFCARPRSPSGLSRPATHAVAEPTPVKRRPHLEKFAPC